MPIFNRWQITRTGVVFVVGVILLVAVVFGGIWIVNQRGEQARRNEAIKIAEQNLENDSKVAGDTSVTQSTPDTTVDTHSDSSVELPKTGADLNQVIIVTILALAVAYYLTSRRAVREI